MKISKEQYEKAIKAAMNVTGAGNGARPRYQSAASAILNSLGIEVVMSAEDEDAYPDLWVPRTWLDVRQGDIVRPPGQDAHRAHVATIGPVCAWHAAPNANQYRPNESPAEWSARPVTMVAMSGVPFTPEHGVKPDAPVEILLTQAEVDAIELLGGWGNRLDPQ